MTPKEKAIELVNKYKEFTEDNYAESYCNAKQCALIAVDEVIDNIEDDFLENDLKYWQEVKQEIEKL